MRCPAGSPPENGFLTFGSSGPGARAGGDAGDAHFVGDTLEYHCKPGFMMEGHPLAECGADGRWHPSASPPTCSGLA